MSEKQFIWDFCLPILGDLEQWPEGVPIYRYDEVPGGETFGLDAVQVNQVDTGMRLPVGHAVYRVKCDILYWDYVKWAGKNSPSFVSKKEFWEALRFMIPGIEIDEFEAEEVETEGAGKEKKVVRGFVVRSKYFINVYYRPEGITNADRIVFPKIRH